MLCTLRRLQCLHREHSAWHSLRALSTYDYDVWCGPQFVVALLHEILFIDHWRRVYSSMENQLESFQKTGINQPGLKLDEKNIQCVPNFDPPLSFNWGNNLGIFPRRFHSDHNIEGSIQNYCNQHWRKRVICDSTIVSNSQRAYHQGS